MKLCYPLKVTKRNITSSFGNRKLKDGTIEFHAAWDDAEPAGTPILACYDGIVRSVNTDSARGKYLTIWHDKLVSASQYQHCKTITAKKGQQVKKGEVIAFVGSTGNSSGPHLDFSMGTEISDAGNIPKEKKFNPDKYEWEFYNAVLEKPKTEFITPKAATMPIRKEPNGVQIGLLKWKELAELTGFKNGTGGRLWYQIRYNGLTGYVSAAFSRKI